MQIRKPPENKFIQLTVELQEATLSFLLGSNWLNIDAPDAPDRQTLSEVWQSVAMAHSAAATYAATAMSDMDTLSQLVQCKHTDILPASAAQPSLTAVAVESASAASRPLVLLIHALGTVAVSRQAAVVPGLRNLRLEVEMKQLALQHPSGTEHGITSEQQDDLTVLMRCAILLLKLADLTPAKAAEDASVALWLAIGRLVDAFGDHGDAPTASVCQPTQASASEQQQLTLVLVQLVLRILQHNQGIWQTSGTTAPGSVRCFQLLCCLVDMPATQSTAIPPICSKGNVSLILPLTVSCYSSSASALQYRLHSKWHARNWPSHAAQCCVCMDGIFCNCSTVMVHDNICWHTMTKSRSSK